MVATEVKPAPQAPAGVLTPNNASMVNNKPIAPNPAHVPPPPLTQKNWVIPPRPKPGRKPALDAPPTKRKAQNREAQRAFRQRRAAKVGELEDQMKQMEEEDTREQSFLRTRIAELEMQVNEYARLLTDWTRKYEGMEREYECEKRTRRDIELELRMVKQGPTGPTDAVKLPSREVAGKQGDVAYEKQYPQEDSSNDLTCGGCDLGDRCQCIEDAFEMNNITTDPTTNNIKRAHSPQNSGESGKRPRCDDQNDEPTEIDFTTSKTSTLPSGNSNPASSNPPVGPDPCGFCQDGTLCICAEIYRQEQQQQQQQQQQPQQLTPPAEAPPDVINLPPLNSIRKTSSSCTNNPGTCGQCLSDPRSTLFCKSLAATRTSSMEVSPAVSDFTGGSRSSTKIAAISTTGPTLSCADAFSTLSRHPAFPQASVELNTWVPQLATRSVPSSTQSTYSKSGELNRFGTASSSNVSSSAQGSLGGRTAFEIEAASVMGVLKFFDRRFGSGGGDGKAVSEGMMKEKK